MIINRGETSTYITRFGLQNNTMDNSQLKRCTSLQRGLDALEKGLGADCKFLVGEEKEEISACKAMLAVASPVFEKQFYGLIAEKDPVELLDVDPNVFKMMLQFIYTHHVVITSKKEALDLIKVAHKYWISDLIKISTIYYLDNLGKEDLKGLCDILNISILYDVSCKDMVIRRVQQSTDLLLNSKEFLDLSADAMTCIVQRGQLNVNSEMELIDAAVVWAAARSEEPGTSLGGKSVKSVLVETGVFKHLRFLTLTDDELKSVQILNDQELKAIKYAIYSGSELPLPASICSITKPRNSKACFKDIKSQAVRGSISATKFESPTTITETFEVSGETVEPINLTDVMLYSQITNVTPEACNIIYEEELQVKIVKLKNHSFRNYIEDPSNVIATGYFAGTMKYNNTITVPLDLKLGVFGKHNLTENDRFKIYVTYYKTGTYPRYKSNTNIYGDMFKSLQPVGQVAQISYTK